MAGLRPRPPAERRVRAADSVYRVATRGRRGRVEGLNFHALAMSPTISGLGLVCRWGLRSGLQGRGAGRLRGWAGGGLLLLPSLHCGREPATRSPWFLRGLKRWNPLGSGFTGRQCVV